MMRLDRHFESNGQTERAAFKVQGRKSFFAKHFDPSCCIGEWRSGHPVKQPVCGKGKKCPNRRTAKSPTAMGVASATHKIASLSNQYDHVFNGQHRADFVRGENQDHVAFRSGHSGTNSIDYSMADCVSDAA